MYKFANFTNTNSLKILAQKIKIKHSWSYQYLSIMNPPRYLFNETKLKFNFIQKMTVSRKPGRVLNLW